MPRQPVPSPAPPCSRGLGAGLLALALVASACSGDPGTPPTALEVTVDTVAGVERVQSAGEAPRWHLELEARIGGGDDGPQAFGRIRSLAAGPDGSVYVADNLAQEIRVFASDGTHLRTFGGAGQGPGEFRELYALAWLDGDLAAFDPGNGRIAVLSPDGTWKVAIPASPMTGPPSTIRLHPLGDDGFYAPVMAAGATSLLHARYTASGTRDTIGLPRPPQGAQSGLRCQRTDGGITGIVLPDGPTMVFGFPPPGGTMASTWTADYRVAFANAAGDTVRLVTRDLAPVPYSDELWAEATEPYERLMEDYPGSQCEPREPVRPESRAPLRHILFDEGGRMWVEAAAESGFTWEVFGPGGPLLGAAPAPPRAPGVPPVVRGDRLYQVEADALGVQSVAVYRLTPEA
jgi:hypothetical protein